MDMVQNNQLETLLGIFQELVVTRTNEVYGFELLEVIVASFPPATLEKYYPGILQVLLTRLQNAKGDDFARCFVRLYHFISARDDKGLGADFFIKIVDQVQEGVFVALYLNIVLPGTQKLVRPLDRKRAVISLTKTLTDSQAFAEKYKKGWAFTCEALLELLENPPVPSNNDGIVVEQNVDDVSFGAIFTVLATIKRPLRDAWAEITDVKTWVGAYLKEADKSHGGKISAFANERLSPESGQVFTAYMK